MSIEALTASPKIIRVLIQGPPGPAGTCEDLEALVDEATTQANRAESEANEAGQAASSASQSATNAAQSATAAATSATNAAQSETDTGVLHGQVMQAAQEVEADRQAVSVAEAWVQANTAGLFADTAAGLAGTAVGAFFVTPGVPGDPNSFVILYRHDAGPVATEIDRAPNAAAVAGLFDDIDIERRDRETLEAIAITGIRDRFKNPPWVIWSDDRGVGAISDEGVITLAGIDMRPLTLPARDAHKAFPNELMLDGADKAFLSVNEDGSLRLAGLELMGLVGEPRDMLGWPKALRWDRDGRIFERIRDDGSLLITVALAESSADITRDQAVYRWGLVDTDNRTNFAVKADGRIYVALAPESLDGLGVEAAAPVGHMAYVTGTVGARKVMLWVEGQAEDQWIFSNLEITDIHEIWQSNDQVEALAQTVAGKTLVTTDLNPQSAFAAGVSVVQMFPWFGQSNAIGWNFAMGVVTPGTLDLGRVAMFNGGVRFYGNDQNNDQLGVYVSSDKFKDLVNLQEIDTGNSSQTPCATMGHGLVPYVNSSIGLLFANGAIGGTTYDERKKGQTPYRNLILAIERAQTIARLKGLSLIVPAVAIIDGEADRVTHTQAQWQAVLEEELADFDADIKARTGQTSDVMIITDQLHANVTGVQLATLQKAFDDPAHFICVGPKYHLPVADDIHLNSTGYALRGYEFARAWQRKHIDGVNPYPLYIASAVLSGSQITLTWGGDFQGPIVIDTTLVSDPGNNGLQFTQTGGNAVTITAVAMLNATQTQVTLSAVPTGTNRKILCARHPNVSDIGPTVGCRSNFRDSSPKVVVIEGTTYPLYRWAAHWELAVT